MTTDVTDSSCLFSCCPYVSAHLQIHSHSLFPSFAFCFSISARSILRKIGSTFPSAWPAGTLRSNAEFHCCSCTLPLNPSWLHTFSEENGKKGSSMMAVVLTAFTAM